MPSVKFFIPIVPKPQKRDRIAVIGGRARSYKSKDQRTQEDNLRELIYRELPTNHLWPIKTAVSLFLTVHLPIPSSANKKQKEGMISGQIRHTKKPDLDNLEKHLLDVGQGVLWENDQQIDEVTKFKRYSESPGWFIQIEW